MHRAGVPQISSERALYDVHQTSKDEIYLDKEMEDTSDAIYLDKHINVDES